MRHSKRTKRTIVKRRRTKGGFTVKNVKGNKDKDKDNALGFRKTKRRTSH